MNTLPLVSIVIPVYNGSNFLREAIDSALCQTYKNIEIIVVNDGSNDNGETEKIALSYGEKIRYIHKENGGVSSALNVGIRSMRGEYFSWLSHDDLYMPYKVEKQVLALNEYDRDDVVVYSPIQQINAKGECIKKGRVSKRLKVGFNEWHAVLNCMLRHGSFNGCSMLIPKKAFEISGFFNEELRYCQDALMWMKIFLNKFDFIYAPEVCVSNRIHGKQLTQTGRSLFHSDSEKISMEIAPIIASMPVYARKLMYSYAYHNAILNNKAVVKNCFKESKSRGLLSPVMKFKIKMAGIYGIIRPFVRRMYYKLVRRVNTK